MAEDWSKAEEIVGPVGFLINAGEAGFGLQGRSGTTRYFRCAPETLHKIVLALINICARSVHLAAGGTLEDPKATLGIVPYRVDLALDTAVPNQIDMLFEISDRTNVGFRISTTLARKISADLLSAAAMAEHTKGPHN